MPRKLITLGTRVVALDARPDRLDLRDLPYRPTLGNLPPLHPCDSELAQCLSGYARAGLVLDQGREGACTGFGLAAVINYLLFVRAGDAPAATPRRVSPAMLYQLARQYDEWPGEDYEGSSCRGALKGWHRHGVCRDTLWPREVRRGKSVFVPPTENAADRDDPDTNWDVDALDTTLGVYYRIDPRSVVDMQAAIRDTGAVYVSATVHEGWAVRARRRLRSHADLARIAHVPKPRDSGGHAFALVGYNDLGFVVQNSWGPGWGSLGFALLPYEDWVSHGDDAWVFTLGVPRRQAVVARRAGAARTVRSPRFRLPPSARHGSEPLQRPVGLVAADDTLVRRYRSVPEAFRPLDTDHAYRHTVLLDRGFAVCNDITAEGPAQALDGAVLHRPQLWLNEHKATKLMIYVHGGLNSEADSITRIRALAPYALGHGIYPLFVTWRSGALETVSDVVEETFARLGLGARGAEPARGWLDRLTEKTDRLLEPILRPPGGALWSQMKLNAERASRHAQGGARLMAERLRALAAQVPGVELHLVGHSAGAIVIGAWLAALKDAGLRVATLRLLAPACTTRFALDHYRSAVRSGTLDPAHWHIHTLSDKNERDDSVGPYRKSLLYLVSRSFEESHKTPLLGLDRTFDPATISAGTADDSWDADGSAAVREWQRFWNSLGLDATHRAAHVLARSHVSTGAGSIAATHGCFDNAVDIMGDALGYVMNPQAPQRVRIYRLDY
jgi:hypothetical protein